MELRTDITATTPLRVVFDRRLLHWLRAESQTASCTPVDGAIDADRLMIEVKP
jgi:hypothetical protein